MTTLLNQMNELSDYTSFLDVPPEAYNPTVHGNEGLVPEGETIIYRKALFPYYVSGGFEPGIQTMFADVLVTKLVNPNTGAQYRVTGISVGSVIFSENALDLSCILDATLSVFGRGYAITYLEVEHYLAAVSYKGTVAVYAKRIQEYVDHFEKTVTDVFKHVVNVYSENDRIYSLFGVSVDDRGSRRTLGDYGTFRTVEYGKVNVTGINVFLNLSRSMEIDGEQLSSSHFVEMSLDTLDYYFREMVDFRLERAFSEM